MLPAYHPGDILLGWQWKPTIKPGDIIVSRVDGRNVIKRVRSIDKDAVEIVGDNPAESTDSRTYGPIKKESITARIIFRLGTSSKP